MDAYKLNTHVLKIHGFNSKMECNYITVLMFIETKVSAMKLQGFNH